MTHSQMRTTFDFDVDVASCEANIAQVLIEELRGSQSRLLSDRLVACVCVFVHFIISVVQQVFVAQVLLYGLMRTPLISDATLRGE